MVTRGIIFLLLFACLTGGVSYADPGETDENEGHYDRLTGEYHYHRTSRALYWTGYRCDPIAGDSGCRTRCITRCEIG